MTSHPAWPHHYLHSLQSLHSLRRLHSPPSLRNPKNSRRYINQDFRQSWQHSLNSLRSSPISPQLGATRDQSPRKALGSISQDRAFQAIFTAWEQNSEPYDNSTRDTRSWWRVSLSSLHALCATQRVPRCSGTSTTTTTFVAPSLAAPSPYAQTAAFVALPSGTTDTSAVTYAAVAMNVNGTDFRQGQLLSLQPGKALAIIALRKATAFQKNKFCSINVHLALFYPHRYETLSARRRLTSSSPRWEPQDTALISPAIYLQAWSRYP